MRPAPKVYKDQPVLMVRMALKAHKDLRVVTEPMAQPDLKAYKAQPGRMVATGTTGLLDLKGLKDQQALRFSIQTLQVNNLPR